jgi:chromate reductase
MTKPLRIVALSGSLRTESYTTKLVKAFKKLAPRGVQVDIVSIAGLPLLEGEEHKPTKAVSAFIHKLRGADAFIFATPEYNRSYTPALKNAIDWASLDDGLVWHEKPAAVLGVTPYSLGAFGAVHHLRQVLVYLSMHPIQQPEFYMTFAKEKFDQKGELTDPKTKEKIQKFWPVFIKWIERLT